MSRPARFVLYLDMTTWNDVIESCRDLLIESSDDGIALRIDSIRVAVYPAVLYDTLAVFIATQVCGEHRIEPQQALRYNGVRAAVLGLDRGTYVLRQVLPLDAGVELVVVAARALAAETRRLRRLVHVNVTPQPAERIAVGKQL